MTRLKLQESCKHCLPQPCPCPFARSWTYAPPYRRHVVWHHGCADELPERRQSYPAGDQGDAGSEARGAHIFNMDGAGADGGATPPIRRLRRHQAQPGAAQQVPAGAATCLSSQHARPADGCAHTLTRLSNCCKLVGLHLPGVPVQPLQKGAVGCRQS